MKYVVAFVFALFAVTAQAERYTHNELQLNDKICASVYRTANEVGTKIVESGVNFDQSKEAIDLMVYNVWERYKSEPLGPMKQQWSDAFVAMYYIRENADVFLVDIDRLTKIYGGVKSKMTPVDRAVNKLHMSCTDAKSFTISPLNIKKK